MNENERAAFRQLDVGQRFDLCPRHLQMPPTFSLLWPLAIGEAMASRCIGYIHSEFLAGRFGDETGKTVLFELTLRKCK